jgi:hypothetical protein
MKLCSVVFAVIFLLVGCGSAGVPTSVTTMLDALIIAADVVPAAIPNLSPQAASCIAGIPPIVTIIADAISGTNAISTAKQAVTDLQSLMGSQCALNVIPKKDASIVQGILTAASAFLDVWKSKVASKSTAEIMARGYAMGFVDKPSSSGHYRPSKADKRKARRIREHAANVAEAMRKGRN